MKNDGDEPATLINFRVTFYGTEADPQPGVPNFVERPKQKVSDLLHNINSNFLRIQNAL